MMKRNVLSLGRRVMMAGCALVLAGAVVSCSKTNDVGGNNGNQGAALMGFNLSDKDAVYIALNNSALTSSPLVYPSYTNGYIGITAGSSSIVSYNASGNASLAQTNFAFLNGNYYSTFLMGANGTYNNVTLRDNFDSLTTASGKAYVRVVNAVPDSTKPTITISGSGETPLNVVKGFGTVSDFVAVNPGPITITANNGGTINASTSITVDNPVVYTVLVLGFPGATDTTKTVKLKFIANGSLN